MTFNEFNKRLEHCHLDEDTKYLLAHMFETQVEINRQLDICASLIAALVQTSEQYVKLHESTQTKLELLRQRDQFPGISVRSEPNVD